MNKLILFCCAIFLRTMAFSAVPPPALNHNLDRGILSIWRINQVNNRLNHAFVPATTGLSRPNGRVRARQALILGTASVVLSIAGIVCSLVLASAGVFVFSTGAALILGVIAIIKSAKLIRDNDQSRDIHRRAAQGMAAGIVGVTICLAVWGILIYLLGAF